MIELRTTTRLPGNYQNSEPRGLRILVSFAPFRSVYLIRTLPRRHSKAVRHSLNKTASLSGPQELVPEQRFLIKPRLFARITVKKPRFLPFWVVGLGVLVLYVAGVVVIVTVDRFLPALPHSADLGDASALVRSFLTVISTFFLLYTIHLQQRIRAEEAVEAH